MAQYLIVNNGEIKASIEATSVKTALEQFEFGGNMAKVQVYRVATGPIDVNIATRSVVDYTFGEEDPTYTGGNFDTVVGS